MKTAFFQRSFIILYSLLSLVALPLTCIHAAEAEPPAAHRFTELKEAAMQGKAEAQYYLASMYEHGQGIEPNQEKAYQWYQKSAEQDYTEAQFSLGQMYYQGRGVKKDIEKSTKYLQKAANMKHEKAKELLLTIRAQRKVRVSEIEVHPEHLEEYLRFVAEVGRDSILQESGVITLYSVQHQGEPTRITILEIYANEEAYQHHLETNHFQKYKQGTLHMVKSLKLIDGKALVPEMQMK